MMRRFVELLHCRLGEALPGSSLAAASGTGQYPAGRQMTTLFRALINPCSDQSNLFWSQGLGSRSEPSAAPAKSAGTTLAARASSAAGTGSCSAESAATLSTLRPASPACESALAAEIGPGQRGIQAFANFIFAQRPCLFCVPLREPFFESRFEFSASQRAIFVGIRSRE